MLGMKNHFNISDIINIRDTIEIREADIAGVTCIRKHTIFRPKENIFVFQVSRPYLVFCPDPKHFIVNCEQNVAKFAENGKKCIEKCNFYIKYLYKIKCYADRPYLCFSKLKPETHIHFFGLKAKE